MWIFSKPPDQLTEADLSLLIGVREHQYLEYKLLYDYDARNPHAKKEMARDVSSIANAGGGTLVIGVDEDGQGRASELVAIQNAEAEARRLVSACLTGIEPTIPGLQTGLVPIPSAGGHVIAIQIPGSYRKPHMVVVEQLREFWIRHDRQKHPMSVEEIRAAVLATEDLEMKVERFIRERRQHVASEEGAFFAVTATPLNLQRGRVATNDRRVKELLGDADGADERSRVQLTRGNVGWPTLRGRRVELPNEGTLEIFRTGHVEFFIRNSRRELVALPEGTAASSLGQPHILHGHLIAEFAFRVLHLARQLSSVASIADPYLCSLSFWGVQGFGLLGGSSFGRIWTEAQSLLPDPVLVGVDERPEVGLRTLLDSLWCAFGYEQCPYFEEDGSFQRLTH